MNEMFVGDDIADRRITGIMWKLQEVMTKMKEQVLGLRETGCDPDTFYNEVWQVATRTRESGCSRGLDLTLNKARPSILWIFS